MADRDPRADPTECQRALVELVGHLESSDYRSSSGVNVVQTAEFLNAKALVALLAALDRRPWWRS
jgi:hypothetical protein